MPWWVLTKFFFLKFRLMELHATKIQPYTFPFFFGRKNIFGKAAHRKAALWGDAQQYLKSTSRLLCVRQVLSISARFGRIWKILWKRYVPNKYAPQKYFGNSTFDIWAECFKSHVLAMLQLSMGLRLIEAKRSIWKYVPRKGVPLWRVSPKWNFSWTQDVNSYLCQSVSCSRSSIYNMKVELFLYSAIHQVLLCQV